VLGPHIEQNSAYLLISEAGFHRDTPWPAQDLETARTACSNRRRSGCPTTKLIDTGQHVIVMATITIKVLPVWSFTGSARRSPYASCSHITRWSKSYYQRGKSSEPWPIRGSTSAHRTASTGYSMPTAKPPARTSPDHHRNRDQFHAWEPLGRIRYRAGRSTSLPTPVRRIWLYLHLVIDVWSRKFVAWNVAERKDPTIAVG